jgi:hypothetical protein
MDWPEAYRSVVERRIQTIKDDKSIGLVESMACKRRFEVPSSNQAGQAHADLRVLGLVESRFKDPVTGGRARSINGLSDDLGASPEAAATLERVREEGYERQLVKIICSDEVPFLSCCYLKENGIRKLEAWEDTWLLQAREDPFLAEQDELLEAEFGCSPEGERRARAHVGCWMTSKKVSKERGLSDLKFSSISKTRDEWRKIDTERKMAIDGDAPPVPPKFKSSDYTLLAYWKLRGKLNVPKERFISYPHCSPDGDDSVLIGWAGWDYEQRAAALAQILSARKSEGWTGERLAPILLGIDELIFWLRKWHGDLGDEYQAFLESEAAAAGLTLDDVRAWTPPAKTKNKRKKARS